MERVTQIQDTETHLTTAYNVHDSDTAPPQDTITPVLHDSLLQRVHDRAFSGDSIEGLPHITLEETNLSPKAEAVSSSLARYLHIEC